MNTILLSFSPLFLGVISGIFIWNYQLRKAKLLDFRIKSYKDAIQLIELTKKLINIKERKDLNDTPEWIEQQELRVNFESDLIICGTPDIINQWKKYKEAVEKLSLLDITNELKNINGELEKLRILLAKKLRKEFLLEDITL